jgi:hypothetical protein
MMMMMMKMMMMMMMIYFTGWSYSGRIGWICYRHRINSNSYRYNQTTPTYGVFYEKRGKRIWVVSLRVFNIHTLLTFIA